MPKQTTQYEKPGLYSNEAFKRAQCSEKIITHHIRKLGSHQLEVCFGINTKL